VKFTLSWLATHLETDAPLARIADTLSAIGLEVESVADRGAAFQGFRVARVVTAEQHPNADRLRLCQVDTGEAALTQVVCGAPNARAGLTTIFAPPGAVIPSTGAVLKVGEIRGVESRGMLCSLRELGLGEEHDGIAELPDTATPGTPFAAHAGLDDTVIEIAVTPNRGDALAVRGIARDLAAAGIGTLRPWTPPAIGPAFDSPITWAIEDREACPWVLGRTIRNVRNGPSPAWLQQRLSSIGLRPISALVDVTNFFAFDLGRPLHVFDADRLAGERLTMRPARPGEHLAALNGQTIALHPTDCVIADDAGPQSLAGIMGGAVTGSQSDTTSVFLECALFDPVRIARSGRRHGLHSDARARFERGIDASRLPAHLDAATALIIDLCGGEASRVTSAGSEPDWQREATLRFDRLASLGGLAVDPELAATRLAALGFEATRRDASRITVAVPPWRNDIAMGTPLEPAAVIPADRVAALTKAAIQVEAECDLIEEVLRLGGLDAIPAISLPTQGAVPTPILTETQIRTATARRSLAARGLAECVSFSFIDGPTASLFAPGLEAGPITLLNPIASDLDRLRPTPLASLLKAAGRNAARGEPDVALFEIGAGFTPDPQTIAAGLRTGRTQRLPGRPAVPRGWQDARADAIGLLSALGVPMDALTTVRTEHPAYHPGQGGEIRQGPRTTLARFGALHPRLLATVGFEHPAAGFEILLDAIAPAKRRKRAAPDLPVLQPVRRDFSFLVDRSVPAETLLRAARAADRALVTNVALFDVYESGDRIPAGLKSLAIEITIQPQDRSLTEGDLARIAASVVANVTKSCGATLRE
jgi:phenylalanyl-tRNA synthetase beta chain